MAQMHEIKSRIKSIQETMQITKAMKLISAAKLKRARAQLDQVLPFFNKVRSTMADILMHSGDIDNIFFDVRNEKAGNKKAYIIITGDRGLAGGYNHNLIKFSETYLKDNPESSLFVAGTMGRNYFRKKKYKIAKEFDYPVQNPTVYRAQEITEYILDLFKKDAFDEVYVIYTHMYSSINLGPTIIKLLPLELDTLLEELKLRQDEPAEIDEILSYEPSPEEVFNILVPKYVKGIIYGVFVEAFTSEQNARMTAMDNATSNAEEMLQKLKLYYNRARQAAITQEISEIVGGAAALNG